MIINISAGHSKNGGAVGINGVKESVLARDFVRKLVYNLSEYGIAVSDCTDNIALTQKENLKNLLKNHKENDSENDYHILVHFNAFDKNSANGSEVYISCKHEKGDSTYLLASDFLGIMKKYGFKIRGIKFDNKLYLLRNLKNAILLEICFITNENDIGKYFVFESEIIDLFTFSILRWCGYDRN